MDRVKTVKLAEGEMNSARFRQIVAEIKRRTKEMEESPVERDNLISSTSGSTPSLSKIENKRDRYYRDRLQFVPKGCFLKI